MIKIPEKIQFVLDTLDSNGYDSYIVGGCVRDSQLGLEPDDFDVATSATPQKVMKIFRRTIPTGIKHGTVTVMIGHTPVEVTTFRTEGSYRDSRHPESVKFITDIKYDLSRRDFTVNALAFNPKKGLVDCFGGLADLENKILRAVGDPEKRFSEDALRILRLFRFSSQLEFTAQENTLSCAIKLQKGLENISRERIFTELFKTLKGKNPSALAPLILSGGLSFLKIEKAPDFNIISNISNPYIRLISFLEKTAENPTEVLKELKSSNKIIKLTQDVLSLKEVPLKTKTDIKYALSSVGLEAVDGFLELYPCEKSSRLLKEIIDNCEPYSISQLAVTGTDLRSLGFEGHDIKLKLLEFLDIVIKDPDKNNKNLLLLG